MSKIEKNISEGNNISNVEYSLMVNLGTAELAELTSLESTEDTELTDSEQVINEKKQKTRIEGSEKETVSIANVPPYILAKAGYTPEKIFKERFNELNADNEEEKTLSRFLYYYTGTMVAVDKKAAQKEYEKYVKLLAQKNQPKEFAAFNIFKKLLDGDKEIKANLPEARKFMPLFKKIYPLENVYTEIAEYFERRLTKFRIDKEIGDFRNFLKENHSAFYDDNEVFTSKSLFYLFDRLSVSRLETEEECALRIGRTIFPILFLKGMKVKTYNYFREKLNREMNSDEDINVKTSEYASHFWSKVDGIHKNELIFDVFSYLKEMNQGSPRSNKDYNTTELDIELINVLDDYPMQDYQDNLIKQFLFGCINSSQYAKLKGYLKSEELSIPMDSDESKDKELSPEKLQKLTDLRATDVMDYADYLIYYKNQIEEGCNLLIKYDLGQDAARKVYRLTDITQKEARDNAVERISKVPISNRGRYKEALELIGNNEDLLFKHYPKMRILSQDGLFLRRLFLVSCISVFSEYWYIIALLLGAIVLLTAGIKKIRGLRWEKLYNLTNTIYNIPSVNIHPQLYQQYSDSRQVKAHWDLKAQWKALAILIALSIAKPAVSILFNKYPQLDNILIGIAVVIIGLIIFFKLVTKYFFSILKFLFIIFCILVIYIMFFY